MTSIALLWGLWWPRYLICEIPILFRPMEKNRSQVPFSPFYIQQKRQWINKTTTKVYFCLMVGLQLKAIWQFLMIMEWFMLKQVYRAGCIGCLDRYTKCFWRRKTSNFNFSGPLYCGQFWTAVELRSVNLSETIDSLHFMIWSTKRFARLPRSRAPTLHGNTFIIFLIFPITSVGSQSAWIIVEFC